MARWLVGAYGPDMDGTAPGVTVLRDRADGSLERDDALVAALASPSFLAVDGDTVYAALEGSQEVVALDRATLAVTERASSGGQWPCHVGVYDGTVVAANYGDGVLGVLGTAPLALVQQVTATGSGPHPAQEGPHAHATFLLADGRVLSADLGADRIHVHDLVDGRLERTASIALPAGTGPRDVAQHSSGTILVMGEHGNTITILDERLEIVETVPVPGAQPTDQGAGLAIAATGFVYTALRGSNTIGVLRIDATGRTLEPVGSVSTAGDWPRHLVLGDGVVHVANQQSSTVASFRLGPDGLPVLIGEPLTVANPTFLLRA